MTCAGLLFLLLLLPGCASREGLSFERFVNAMVELRRASRETKSPSEFAAKKQAIETRLGVTDGQLQRYMRDHRRDVKLLSAAWDSVEARLSRGGVQDAATRPTRQGVGPQIGVPRGPIGAPGAQTASPAPAPVAGTTAGGKLPAPAATPRPAPPRF